MYNNEQEMTPRPRKNFGTPRTTTSMKDSHFHNPFRSPYAFPAFSDYATVPSPHSPFRYNSPYQHQKRHCYPCAPAYSISNLTSAQHPPNWHNPLGASSPYISKNPQNMIQGRGGFSSISPDIRRYDHKNSRTIRLAEQFDVNDYVIPAMTSNPWSKLEEFYANRRLDEQ
ncbi:hypothetical protein ACH3XW_3955 [Acanthocheilonema viteae]